MTAPNIAPCVFGLWAAKVSEKTSIPILEGVTGNIDRNFAKMRI